MVDMPSMQVEGITIRRGRRTDLSALVKLVNPSASTLIDKAQIRHWRRLAGDPRLDFYVAEQKSAIQGAFLVCYVRALQQPGWYAVLEIALTSIPSCELAHAILNVAKTRARQRGCQRILVWREKVETNGYMSILQEGGFRPNGDVLSCDL